MFKDLIYALPFMFYCRSTHFSTVDLVCSPQKMLIVCMLSIFKYDIHETRARHLLITYDLNLYMKLTLMT